MPSSSGVTVQIDPEAGAAYITLGAGKVSRTVEFDEDIYVDLDEFGVVFGIELLDLDRSLPLDDLAERFHINTSTLAGLLRSISWGGATRAAHSSSSPARPVTFGTVTASDPAASTCWTRQLVDGRDTEALADAVAELVADLAGRVLLVHLARIETELLGRMRERLWDAWMLSWPVVDTLRLERSLVTTAWQPDPPLGVLRPWVAWERYGRPAPRPDRRRGYA